MHSKARQRNALYCRAEHGNATRWVSSLEPLMGALGWVSTTVQSKAWQSNAAERNAGHGSALQRNALQRNAFLLTT